MILINLKIKLYLLFFISKSNSKHIKMQQKNAILRKKSFGGINGKISVIKKVAILFDIQMW